jgi:hypothetical protein
MQNPAQRLRSRRLAVLPLCMAAFTLIAEPGADPVDQVSEDNGQRTRTEFVVLNRLDQSVAAVQMRCLLGRVFSVLERVKMVAMGQVSMVARNFVIIGLRVLGSFAMMLRGRFEVLGSFVMMVMNFVLIAHGSLRCLQQGSIQNRSEPDHDSEIQCHLRDPDHGIGKAEQPISRNTLRLSFARSAESNTNLLTSR